MLALEAVAVCLSSTKHIRTEVGVSRAIFEVRLLPVAVYLVIPLTRVLFCRQ